MLAAWRKVFGGFRYRKSYLGLSYAPCQLCHLSKTNSKLIELPSRAHRLAKFNFSAIMGSSYLFKRKYYLLLGHLYWNNLGNGVSKEKSLPFYTVRCVVQNEVHFWSGWMNHHSRKSSLIVVPLMPSEMNQLPLYDSNLQLPPHQYTKNPSFWWFL